MRKLIFLIPTLCIFIVTNNISAQDIEKQSWNTSIYISPSFAVSNSDWSLSHPIGSGRYETITGTFKQSMALNGGIEINKGYFGFQFNIELMPQKLIKSESAINNELDLLIGEFSILFYPMKYSSNSMKPYISLGSGPLKTIGDIDNAGFIISYAAGLKIPILAGFSINLGLKGMRIKYTQLGLAESISKDIRIYPLKLHTGVFWQL